MIRSIVILVLFSLYITSGHADDLEDSRIELETNKKVQVSKSSDLAAEQSAPFWNVYANHEKTVEKSQIPHLT